MSEDESVDDELLLAGHAVHTLTGDVAAVLQTSATDGMLLATVLGFVLMLLYTIADAHKAWEAAHQLSMNVCMAVLCWAFLPLVVPFIRSPWAPKAEGTLLQTAGWALGLLADYTLLIGTIAFACLGVLLFLAARGPAYMVALLLVECVGCWGFLLSACAYAASWVLGTLPAPQAAKGVTATGPPAPSGPGADLEREAVAAARANALNTGPPATDGPGPDTEQEAAAARARALAVNQLEWWGHALNIGGSLVYVLASTSSTLLVLAGGNVPVDDAQTALRQAMAQTFVFGDVFWTCDAAVFVGIWVRDALKAQRAKRSREVDCGPSEASKLK
jgi:hypothetical protein